MAASDIVIKGAREHNLRDVALTLPRNQLICLTGVSGSGKSSLAFDTLYAEGQRRYVESLSSFARQFLGQMPKPDVDYIGGLSPSISISQKTAGRNPRSTVGTITEIYDYLRVLFARAGQGECPNCGRAITAQTREQIIARILALPAKTRFSVLAPVIRQQKGEYRDLFVDLIKQGFVRARVDGTIVALSDQLKLDRQMRHNIEVVVDRLANDGQARGRLAEAVELALSIGDGNLIVALQDDAAHAPDGLNPPPAPDGEPSSESNDSGATSRNRKGRGRTAAGVGSGKRKTLGPQPGDISLSAHYACTHCDLSFQPPSPQLFSFNNPQGMCIKCDGLGEIYSFDPERLATEPDKSFKQGCFELVGPWKEMGRWRRHIYQGVADTMEYKLGLDSGVLLESPWNKLPPKLRDIWLWGTGETHITFTWRGGAASHKYGGLFDGIIPELLSKHRNTKSKPKLRQLEKFMRVMHCPGCGGDRLNPQARAVKITTAAKSFGEGAKKSLPQICQLTIAEAVQFFSQLEQDPLRTAISVEVLKEIRGRLGFLVNVGLDYLTLDRTAPTLSGGEAQRIRLAGQIGCGLVGVLYILDEPSIGLHPRDNDRLLSTLHQLRDLGNTVVVVEHDEDTMRAADHIVDFGPGPGVRGGEVVAAGGYQQVVREKRSLTGQFLAGKEKIDVPGKRRTIGEKSLRVLGAAHNNLKEIDVEIPLGGLVCITGVSGSGKSSLVNGILVEALRRDLNHGEGQPGPHRAIEGLEHLDKLIAIDQSPIGRTPRSNPGTYIKVLDDIRHLYTRLPEAKRRGYAAGRFSFNVKGGRCEACEGNGSNRLEMDFLADVWVTCPVCGGHRFNRETLQVRFKDKSISDVLEMDVQQALAHFENIPAVSQKLQTLHDVGLDYIKLGQPSPTLSGGEAQRIKLARELVKKSTGQTLYLLDEPTTGLHFADIRMLLRVLHGFADAGNTVLVVEHNLEVIKTADWIIDLGPEGGDAGGRIVAVGTPEQVAKEKNSHTGRVLAGALGSNGATKSLRNGSSLRTSPKRRRSTARRPVEQIKNIIVRGASQHNLRHIDVEIPRDQTSVFCGPSGSGKTSLAMDTIYAEGQRRYVESLSSYARQFVAQMPKPQLDHIDGLSPAIAIEQRQSGHSPRSTVGTVTEIYDYLRILFARLGSPYCPDCEIPIGTQTADEIIDKILSEPPGTKLYLMAPLAIQVGESYETLWSEIRAGGYVRMRVDGQTCSVDEPPTIDRRRKHAIEVVIDRLTVRDDARSRVAGSVENALTLGKGVLHLAYVDEEIPEPQWRTETHSQHFACQKCGRSFQPLTPHSFSFNSPLGWCEACEGLGVQTGANPAALVYDPKLTLAQGAILLWPNVELQVVQAMLAALSSRTGVPIDVPYERLSTRQRRIVMFGCGEQWFDVPGIGHASLNPGPKRSSDDRLLFRFQYKGLYPALEEASRLSQSLRARLEHLVDEIECTTCGGGRLREDAGAVRFRDATLDQVCRRPLGELLSECQAWNLSTREQRIAGELVREITTRLEFLVDVGLDYLTLARSAPTLSGGEAQRIRLASQVGSGLCGVLYVLDEPTIGLHPRDNKRLIRALDKLRDLGNTLLVVEHDREVVASADRLFDFGPAAGKQGGRIVAQGSPRQVAAQRASVTGPYLSGKKAIPIPTNRRMAAVSEVERPQAGGDSRRRLSKSRKSLTRVGAGNSSSQNGDSPTPPGGGWLEIVGARHHNLQNVTARIPLGALTAVTGPSGCGKSSLVDDILYQQLARVLHRARTFPGVHEALRGVEQINKVIRVDQQPLGNTPSSNPATYTGVFDLVRELFAQLPDAKLRGYAPRRFSFNVPGGRCEACEGNGQLCIEMHFLPDVWVECDTCGGKRYNAETLGVKYHGRSIADVLEMSCGDAVRLFENIPRVRRTLQTLCDVGLDYLTLGQSAPTLSGGEAQRVKLAAELSRPDTGRTLYLLDEPTTGLHFDDLAKLLEVLNRLVDMGNTIVVIEHNLDVVKTADWIIDIGPEAGDGGGRIVVAGTPEDVAAHGQAALRAHLQSQWNNDQSPVAQSTAQPKRKRSTTRKAKATGEPVAATTPPLLRSYTGEALAAVLAAGPHKKRSLYDFAAEVAKREGDLEIRQVGQETDMPWEVDGRRWHTRERVSRSGQPSRWDGRILDRVERFVQKEGVFSPTNWNARTIVEISADRKSDGWFMHAITGETWLLKLKFRVAKNTFGRDDLASKLKLTPLNELPDLPVYGHGPRVRCKNLRGPWQEVQIDLHSLAEVDRPEFWDFVKKAVEGFKKYIERLSQSPEAVMPWTVLGRKWHATRKGFPPGKPVRWDPDLLEQLCDMLAGAAPDGQFLWNNQHVVHFMIKQQKEPWASLYTKKPEGIDLVLTGPKDQFALGRIAGFGAARQVTPRESRDQLKIRFREHGDLRPSELKRFLAEHLASIAIGNGG